MIAMIAIVCVCLAGRMGVEASGMGRPHWGSVPTAHDDAVMAFDPTQAAQDIATLYHALPLNTRFQRRMTSLGEATCTAQSKGMRCTLPLGVRRWTQMQAMYHHGLHLGIPKQDIRFVLGKYGEITQTWPEPCRPGQEFVMAVSKGLHSIFLEQGHWACE